MECKKSLLGSHGNAKKIEVFLCVENFLWKYCWISNYAHRLYNCALLAPCSLLELNEATVQHLKNSVPGLQK